MKTKSIGWRELAAQGFTLHKGYRRKFYEVTTLQGERAVMLRQSKFRWHCFYSTVEATGSGSNPLAALSGGLGDVIDNDSQLRTYSRMVLDAPQRLLMDCDGLYRASSQVFNT